MTDTLTRPAPVAAEPPLRRRGERIQALAAGARVSVPAMPIEEARRIVDALAGVSPPLPDGVS